MRLTINIATRGRPEALKATLERMLPNIVRDDTVLLVSFDEDDETIPEDLPEDPHLRVSIRPREDTRGLKYERARQEAPADLYLIGHDCAPITTRGFDQMMVEAAEQFPDGIGVVCTPLANPSFPAFQAPTAKLVDIMGYIYHPAFPFWFIDHWLDDIARMIGRYQMVPVEVNHAATRPQKTIGLKDLEFWCGYYDALAGERREQAERILAAMDEPEWRRNALRFDWIMLENRSRSINDGVRANAAAIEEARGEGKRDARYQRVKRAAEEHFQELNRRGWLKIGLCIACYDGRVADATMTSIARTKQLAAAKGIEIFEIIGRGNPVLPDVRNWCVAQALAAGCHKVWFVDSDIAWDNCVPDVLNMLIAPADIIAGVYQARNNLWNDPARMVVQWDKIPPEIDEGTGCWIVKRAATGFMCIDRSVFERMAKAGVVRNYLPNQIIPKGNHYRYYRDYFWYDFRPVGDRLAPDLAEFLESVGYDGPLEMIEGEDFYFCRKASEIGCKVLADPRITLTHFDGRVQHTASLKDVKFEPQEAA
jgi:hypothetical protein